MNCSAPCNTYSIVCYEIDIYRQLFFTLFGDIKRNKRGILNRSHCLQANFTKKHREMNFMETFGTSGNCDQKPDAAR